MSEFHIQVVRLGPIEKHANADTLSITRVHGGYPCIIRTGDFQEGELAVYVPVDALVNTQRPEFASFAARADKTGWMRVRALRLRGVFSMGLLLRAEPGWVEGQDLRAALGVEKWEPPIPDDGDPDEAPDPGVLPAYDIEGLRRWPQLLTEGEEVVITEKIDGANARAVWHEGRLHIGTRNTFKRPDGNSPWARAARQYDLATKLKESPYALYFELYGHVQALRYGLGNQMYRIAVFDALDTRDRRWLSADPLQALLRELDLPMAPPLYRGPWHPELAALAEGDTTLPGAEHVREGIVIRPAVERWDDRIGRVQLKLHGEGYLTRK